MFAAFDRSLLIPSKCLPYRNSTKAHQELLLDLTWAIWPELPAYGRKAAQFVDLLGYFSLKTPQTEKKVDFTNNTNADVCFLIATCK